MIVTGLIKSVLSGLNSLLKIELASFAEPSAGLVLRGVSDACAHLGGKLAGRVGCEQPFADLG